MPIKYEEYSINEIFKKNIERKLVLPNFQRGFVWQLDKQTRMISSFLVSVPIGSLLILEGKQDDFAARDLCLKKSIEPNDECQFILDGQQRLSTLKTALNDVFNYFENKNDPYVMLYNKLHCRWYVQIVPEQKQEDVFGIQFFTAPKLDKLEPEELVDFIKPKKIFKKYEEEWYHPHYIPENQNELACRNNQGRQIFARKCAQNNLVPLFELIFKEHGIHREVLEKIASTQANDLRARIKDNDKEAEDIFYKHGRSGEDIEGLIDDESFWQRLIHRWINKVSSYLEKLVDNKIPVIELPQEEINRAVAIFEQLNEGGTPLNIFDLIVAKSAKQAVEEISLTDRICEQIRLAITHPAHTSRRAFWSSEGMGTIEENHPSKHFQDFFLNNLSLHTYIKIKGEDPRIDFIKKSGILNLTSSEINDNYLLSLTAVNRAMFFLQNRCGIFSISGVSYKLMLQPIAFILEDENMWHKKEAHDMLEYWYWVSLFGGAYRDKPNEKCIDDVAEFYKFFYNNDNSILSRLDERESLIFNYQNYSDSSTLLNQNTDATPPKAIRYAILQYVLSKQPKDLLDTNCYLSAEKISSHEIIVDTHHIIPLANASNLYLSARELRSNSYYQHILNSPLNLTYVLSQTNSKLRNFAPSVYINEIKDKDLAGLFLTSGDDLIKRDDESLDAFYQRVLTARFNLLKNSVYNHVRELKNIAINTSQPFSSQ